MAYRLRRLLGEGGRSYENFKQSTRGDGLGTFMATWHTHTNSRYPVSRARVHIRPWSDGILEYCNRDSTQHSSIPPLRHAPLYSTLICVISISPAATEHIIECTRSAAYTSANGSAFADIGMRRGADSRARCPANCRASQSSTTTRHEAQK